MPESPTISLTRSSRANWIARASGDMEPLLVPRLQSWFHKYGVLVRDKRERCEYECNRLVSKTLFDCKQPRLSNEVAHKIADSRLGLQELESALDKKTLQIRFTCAPRNCDTLLPFLKAMTVGMLVICPQLRFLTVGDARKLAPRTEWRCLGTCRR